METLDQLRSNWKEFKGLWLGPVWCWFIGSLKVVVVKLKSVWDEWLISCLVPFCPSRPPPSCFCLTNWLVSDAWPVLNQLVVKATAHPSKTRWLWKFNCIRKRAEISQNAAFYCLYVLIQRLSLSRLFSLGECGRGARAVEMDDLPLPVAAVPHSGLLWLGGARRPVGVDVLRHSDVSNARGLVANQVDVRVQDGGVDWFTVFRPHWGVQIKVETVKGQNSQSRGKPSTAQELTVFKIKAMEVEAFHQIPQSLGLECRHSRVTHFPVGVERLLK